MRVIEHWDWLHCHNHSDWQCSENLLQQIKNHFNKGHYIENDIESKRHDGRKTVHVITNKSNRQKTASADSAGTSDRSAAKVLSCLRCGASFESLQVRKCLESSSSYGATVLSFCVGRASNSRSSFFYLLSVTLSNKWYRQNSGFELSHGQDETSRSDPDSDIQQDDNANVEVEAVNVSRLVATTNGNHFCDIEFTRSSCT